MRKVLQLLLVIVIAVVAVVGFRWYRYVTNTESPYEEVGITLNNMMPGPINAWGCAKLKASFGNGLPPYGCQAADGTSWR